MKTNSLLLTLALICLSGCYRFSEENIIDPIPECSWPSDAYIKFHHLNSDVMQHALDSFLIQHDIPIDEDDKIHMMSWVDTNLFNFSLSRNFLYNWRIEDENLSNPFAGQYMYPFEQVVIDQNYTKKDVIDDYGGIFQSEDNKINMYLYICLNNKRVIDIATAHYKPKPSPISSSFLSYDKMYKYLTGAEIYIDYHYKSLFTRHSKTIRLLSDEAFLYTSMEFFSPEEETYFRSKRYGNTSEEVSL